MPIINVKLLADAFSTEQKHAMIDEMTKAMVKVVGESIRPAVIVLVEEVPNGMWAMGGHRLTVEEIEERRRLRAAKGTT